VGSRSAPIRTPHFMRLADDFSDLLLFWPGSCFGADSHKREHGLAPLSPCGPSPGPYRCAQARSAQCRGLRPNWSNRAGDQSAGRKARLIDIQASARRSARSLSRLDRGKRSSMAACVSRHIGTAATRSASPAGVNFSRRVRLSASSILTFTRPRRSSGFKFAVNVVRSIASKADTLPMLGASSRLSDIKSENCPFVRPSGCSTASKRRATARAARCKCRQRQVSRTSTVIAKGRCCSLDTGPLC
jgi:hypothetical protein